MNDSPVCNINIEKSYKALELEKTLGVDWGFDNDNPLDTYVHLRACLSDSVTIGSRKILPIPTGIYPHILSPRYELEVRSFSTIVYQYGLAVADGISCFNYGFRNEIWVLLENKNDQAQIIQPGQKIALLSVVQRPLIVINYVDEIEKNSWKTRSQGYVQKVKRIINKSINPDNPNRFKEKTEKFSEGYSRAEIDLIMKDNKDESNT